MSNEDALVAIRNSQMHQKQIMMDSITQHI